MIRRAGAVCSLGGVAVAVRSASIVSAVAVAGLLSGTAYASAGDPTAGTGVTPPSEQNEPAQVQLLDLSPAVPTETDTLTLSGTVTNTSGETLTRLNTYLRMSRQPATDRDGLALMTEPDYRAGFRPGPFEPLVDTLEAGHAATFQLEVPVSELGLTTPGIYPIGVEILASFEDGTRDEVGSSITLVPWLPPTSDAAPNQDDRRVAVAVAVPLMAAVDQAPDGSYLSERLGELFAPSGQLGALLAGSADPTSNRATVTWLVDPALLEAAADLADGYQVRRQEAGESTLEPGTHSDDAAGWLAKVADRARVGAVELLPYGNVDLVALVRAGLADDVAAAIAAAPVRAATALEPGGSSQPDPPPRNLQLDDVTMLYPPGGAVDAATLQVLAANGVRGLLLADTAVDSDPGAQRVTVSDGAGSTVTAVPVDAALGSIFAAGTSTTAALTSVQARQRALAYTAVATLDSTGSDAPLVVVVPPDPPSPTGSAALDVLTGAAPWVTPVSLTSALASAAAEPATVSYSAADAAAELSPAYVQAISDLRAATQTLRSLTGDAETADELDLARLRAESASWRDDPAGRARTVTELTDAVATRVGAVRIVSTGTVTMSSDSGRFPLTVANDLDQPVTVRLALTARTPARLQTSGPELVEVAAGAKTTIDVSAKATTNGVYVIDARLTTAGGAPFGAPTPITVRATQYDTVAWVVMGAAGGLIVIGSGVRLAGRFRAARGARA